MAGVALCFLPYLGLASGNDTDCLPRHSLRQALVARLHARVYMHSFRVYASTPVARVANRQVASRQVEAGRGMVA